MRAKGSATKRGDGRWATSVRLPSGRRQYLYADSQRAVLRKAAALRQALAEGRDGTEDRRTVEAYLTEWLESTTQRVRPSTARRYEQLVRRHALPALGRLTLAQLRPAVLQGLYTDLVAAGLAPATVRQLHAILHHALAQAARWGLVSQNVADLVTPPRVPRYEARTLTAQQARTLLAAVRGDALEALYVLALYTGLRQGELLGLRWADVDLERGRLAVRGTLGRDATGTLAVAETKTARSRRQVPLAPSAVTALRAHGARQAEARLRAGPAWQGTDLIFTEADGRPLNSRELLRGHWYPLLARAGLPRIRFHDLRHTVATLLLEEGVHPRVAADALGHSTTALTLNTYSHVSATVAAEAAARLARLLDDAG